MNDEKTIVERERILIWFLIPFILSCIGFISTAMLAIMFYGSTFISFMSSIYIAVSLCLFLLTFTCYMACFQHKRTAALSAAIISLFTAQWISAVLLFIGYDKQKKLDEMMGETWNCRACNRKERLERFPYSGLCMDCAVSTKKQVKKLLNQIEGCVKIPEKEIITKCLDEIEHIRRDRNEYPMVKKSFHAETEKLLEILIEIDSDNEEEYRDRITLSKRNDEAYKVYLSQKSDVEKTNKLMTVVTVAVISFYSVLAIAYFAFMGVQITELENSINNLFNFI